MMYVCMMLTIFVVSLCYFCTFWVIFRRFRRDLLFGVSPGLKMIHGHDKYGDQTLFVYFVRNFYNFVKEA